MHLPTLEAAPAVAMGAATRNKRLDVLRCVAVLLVILRHTESKFFLAAAGWIGVDLFFVLSGFLISGLLFSEYQRRGSISFKRFLIRRWFKLYPAFCVFMLVTLLVEVFIFHEVSSGRRYLVEMLYLRNYLRGVWGHTWSLAVEEHFYLLLPAFLLITILVETARAGGRRLADPFRVVVPTFVAAAVSCLAMRALDAHRLPDNAFSDWNNYYHVTMATHHRIDGLFFGVVLGYAHHFRPQLLARVLAPAKHRIALAALAAGLIAPALVLPAETKFMMTVGVTLLYLGFGIVLMLGMRPRAGAGAPVGSNRLLSRVGDVFARVGVYSYSIYLWHVAVHDWGADLARRWFGVELSGAALFVPYFVMSLAVGIGMARLVEVPFLRLRDVLFPAMQRQPVPAAATADAAEVVVPTSPPSRDGAKQVVSSI